MRPSRLLATFTTLLLAASVCTGAGAQPEAPSEAGTPNLLFFPQDQREIAFGTIRELAPTRTVAASDSPRRLADDPADFSSIHYRVGLRQFTLDDFLARTAHRGLIAVQGDRILFEHYAPGHSDTTRWISFSVTKSITSMLIGAAIQDGFINSVDEPIVDYLPRLKGSAYDGVRIEDLLHMASGVAWDEDYEDPESDVARAGALNGIELMDYLSQLPRAGTAGKTFNYNTGETNLAGQVLRAAIGNNASSYLEHKIWRPFGMEHDAYWLLSAPGGVETGGCCLNATLRDYARVGQFALANGVLDDGTRVLPAGWMDGSTTPSEGYEGYGYLWWLYDQGAYAARGIFQQWIFVDPARNLVIAAHNNALRATQDEDYQHTQALILALRESIDPTGN